MKNKFMLLVSTVLVVLAATSSWGAAKPYTGNHDYPENLGTATTDTLNWSDQGSYSLRDTLVVATSDTTTGLYDISGCSYIALWVIASGLNAPTYHHIAYRIQVSPDAGTWVQLTTAFSTMIKAATPATDTLVGVIYDRDYAIDTLAARDVTLTMKLPVGRDFRLIKAARFLRVIAVPSGGTTGDTTIVKSLLRREWAPSGR